MKPIVIVVGDDSTQVYALGDVELYMIKPESCAQMVPDLLQGTTHPENTFQATPGTPHEFVNHVAQTEFLRHLPAAEQIIERLCEEDDERRHHGRGRP